MRIALFGPPLSGKTTIIKTVCPRTITMFEIPSNHPTYELPPHRGVSGAFTSAGSLYELVTMPGGVIGDGPWQHLLAEVRGVAVVLDPQADEERLRDVLGQALRLIPAELVRCLVLTKTDLVPVDVVRQKRLVVEAIWERARTGTPLMLTRADKPKTHVAVIDVLIAST